jgi:hypothetical protein
VSRALVRFETFTTPETDVPGSMRRSRSSSLPAGETASSIARSAFKDA